MTAVEKKKLCSLLERAADESGSQSDGARLISCFASYLYNCVVSDNDDAGIDKMENKKPSARKRA